MDGEWMGSELVPQMRLPYTGNGNSRERLGIVLVVPELDRSVAMVEGWEKRLDLKESRSMYCTGFFFFLTLLLRRVALLVTQPCGPLHFPSAPIVLATDRCAWSTWSSGQLRERDTQHEQSQRELRRED